MWTPETRDTQRSQYIILLFDLILGKSNNSNWVVQIIRDDLSNPVMTAYNTAFAEGKGNWDTLGTDSG